MDVKHGIKYGRMKWREESGVTGVKCMQGITEDASVRADVHEGSALSPKLFSVL